jgi:hypothetical protein
VDTSAIESNYAACNTACSTSDEISRIAESKAIDCTLSHIMSGHESRIVESDGIACNPRRLTPEEESQISKPPLIDCDARCSTSDEELEVTQGESETEDSECLSISDGRSERYRSLEIDTKFELTLSFEFWNADRLRSIESVVLFDGHQSVREKLVSSPRPSVCELAILVGEGIVREGNRCLHSPRDSANGRIMFEDLKDCLDIRSLLRLCVNFYTRATFLYRCVNKFMREASNPNEETGRNIGIYIGFLRECFSVRSDVNPLEWTLPQKLYRGANFSVGVIVDYARHEKEYIWWQGFTSASADINQARRFQGNVLFEIVLADPVPSLAECSAFPEEQEFILNPYQRFTLDGVRWSDSLGRWIIQVGGCTSPGPVSWFDN